MYLYYQSISPWFYDADTSSWDSFGVLSWRRKAAGLDYPSVSLSTVGFTQFLPSAIYICKRDTGLYDWETGDWICQLLKSYRVLSGRPWAHWRRLGGEGVLEAGHHVDGQSVTRSDPSLCPRECRWHRCAALLSGPAGRRSCQEGVWQPWGGRRGPCRLLTSRSVGGSWWNSAHAAPQRTLWLLRTNGPRWGLQPSLPML